MATLLRHGASRVSSASSSWRGSWTGTSFKSFSRSLFVEVTTEEQVSLRHLSGAEEGVAVLTLNRPDARNAIGVELLKQLRDVLEALQLDTSARALLVCSSVPGVFCAGADLKERRNMGVAEAQRFVNTLRSTFSSLEVLSMPTIAVVEGAALGGGMELALACDIRVCGDNAVFGLPETGLAIIPGAGGTQRLPRLVGRPRAKELIFTGRRIDAEHAEEIGTSLDASQITCGHLANVWSNVVVTHIDTRLRTYYLSTPYPVCRFDELLFVEAFVCGHGAGLVNHCVLAGTAYKKALDIGCEIIKQGPLAVKLAKVAIERGSEVDSASGMVIEEACYAQVLQSKDRLEGLDAFAEKRKPTYHGH